MIEDSVYYDKMYTTRHEGHLCGSKLSFYKDHFATQIMRAQCQHGHWLDVGCGCGEKDWYTTIANPVRIVGLDFSPVALQRTRSLPSQEGLQWVHANATALPFGAGQFDGCICSHVLEHIREPGWLLAEMIRLTKPSGRLVIIVPHLHYADDPSHCWHFTVEQLSALLNPWGATDLELSPCGNQIAATIHLGEADAA